MLDELEGDEQCVRLYYLATAPGLYEQAIAQLGAPGLAEETCGPRRIVIEKPFGSDLKSAEQLNAKLHEVFAEHQVYRIDHYLGKETVQNLFVLRFANSIFEPLWNRNYIDHVQITVAEEVVVGKRAAYYEHSGILRDMFQNHLLQLMTITAMEAPARYDADMVRDEKVKVLRSVRPIAGRGLRPRGRPRAIRRLSQGKGCRPRQQHGHVRGAAIVDRQLALAGRAVLSAQRQGLKSAARRRS